MQEWSPVGEGDPDSDVRLRLLAETLLTSNGNQEAVLDLLELSVFAVLAGEDAGAIAELIAESLRPAQA